MLAKKCVLFVTGLSSDLLLLLLLLLYELPFFDLLESMAWGLGDSNIRGLVCMLLPREEGHS
jgi:hypothetical protein